MKIGVIVTEPIRSGGGFNQALNAVLQIERLSEGRFKIEVYCFYKESLPLLKRLGIIAKPFRFGLSDRLAVITKAYPLIGRLLRRIARVGAFERRLINDGVDLVFFTSPCQYAMAMNRLSYITTVWDLCHRDLPEFPEVAANGEFERRERLYRSTLPKAFLILVDSMELAIRVCQRYGIDDSRILPMPFAPAPFLVGKNKTTNRVNLIEGDYFFYPAQFWPHKNHVRILEALRLLKGRMLTIKVAFCGKDYGNLNWVREQASKLGVADQVHFLGFVPADEMENLYDNCLAVLMPTYFGPTNIPPLEAWFKGKPLIYSKHLRGQTGDAAWMIDPDSAENLAEGIEAMLKEENRKEYSHRGRLKLEKIMSERRAAEIKLMYALTCFELRRKLWK
ncbi:MAG: glycosyltransferase [Clostridia bacterium]|nr:glycosyltransferase [Clostridia bacterium]